MNEEFILALNQLENEKGVKKDIIFDALESALLTSYKKNFGTNQNVEVKINREDGHIDVFANREVVEEVEDELLQISIDDAKKINHRYELGDIYKETINPKDFGRIAAQTAKQVVIQKIKDAERDIIYDEFLDRENELITGLIQRSSKGYVYVELGNTEGILPPGEQIKGEDYSHGNRYKMLLLEVKKTSKGPQIILSRSHPNLIKRLFEIEVPEIHDGIVEIYSIAREAGSRTKIAVFSKNEEVDALGACVGYKGQRVKAIVDDLHDEKIDIVIWEKEIDHFIANSLSPSSVEKVFVDDKEKSALVVVPDYQLSLAIGKEGQNARLAAKLTNWKIDIKSESQFEEYLEENNMTEDDLYEKLGYESEEDYEMRKGNEVEENEESNDELSDFQGE
ncbi:N utilization substance protein A [Peptoniphilus koenoeneniae]|uniref:Transcription termination/antitermination protein NusA n=1 Tax=Peptoniphilus koenoeneniae TaxID=507751 RepID=A0ABU0ASR7_9FIRM|nr:MULTISPECIES: transcription termination factor NusA [Peptoniphilus]ERT56711.1 transcription termination factor NusA [Peptoniphilus sp. BV3C26]MDQ0274065.1 N utilization substance protein A [Peptoniphilus koenoeneniae]